MGQIVIGSVTLVSGESTVIGAGTNWLSTVNVGDTFTRRGQNVAYEIAGITDNTHIILSSTYVGSGESGAQYEITQDFTPNYSFVEINKGDVDWPYHLTRSLRTIDEVLATVEAPVTYTATTVNNTVTTLMTRGLNLSEAILLEANVIGRGSGSGEHTGLIAGYNIKAAFKKNSPSGEATLVSTPVKIAITDDNVVTAWDVNVIASGNNAVIQIQGSNGTIVNWKGYTRVLSD